MSIDKKTLHSICRLARISIADDQAPRFMGDCEAILAWVAEMNEVDTTKTEPLASPVRHPLPMRADDVAEGNDVEAVLGNAPDRTNDFYVVPKVVE